MMPRCLKCGKDPATRNYEIKDRQENPFCINCKDYGHSNAHFHSRFLLHSHWISASEVTPSSPNQRCNTMNTAELDRGLKAADAA
ncbi:hypothetical protein TNCV_2985381 [Trichonephila clavipes]|nr:hypothetical protein TNCV_2985381 [Trichonephila clavipes]